MKEPRVTGPIKDVNVLPKTRPRHDPNSPIRHNGFQFKGNPMEEMPFEQKLIIKEKLERHKAKVDYVLGIQGVDGGKCYDPNRDN
jgi:hypothetical protein